MGGVVGTILNPIGAVAPKSGAGQWLDPAGAIGKMMPSGMRDFADPAGGIREGGFKNQELLKNQQDAAENQKQSQAGSGKTGQSLLTSG